MEDCCLVQAVTCFQFTLWLGNPEHSAMVMASESAFMRGVSKHENSHSHS